MAAPDQPTLLGIAAVVSAVGGCASTILAIRKARDEETQKCLERLKEARAEGERLAEELHAMRMRDLDPSEQPPRGGWHGGPAHGGRTHSGGGQPDG